MKEKKELTQLMSATVQAEEQKKFLEEALGFRNLHWHLTCCSNLIPNQHKDFSVTLWVYAPFSYLSHLLAYIKEMN